MLNDELSELYLQDLIYFFKIVNSESVLGDVTVRRDKFIFVSEIF